jgi:hypothetical protein
MIALLAKLPSELRPIIEAFWTQPKDSTSTRIPRPYGRPRCLFLSSRPRHLPVLELFLRCQT